MVMFEKNGQGYFDFDFNALVELTTKEFAREIAEELKREYVQGVNLFEGDNFIGITIVGMGLVLHYSFNRQTGNINHTHVPLHAALWAAEVLNKNEKHN